MNARQLALIFILFSGLAVLEMLCSRREHSSSPLPAGRSRFPVLYGDKWGYIDVHGALVIAPEFYAAEDFSEGLAAVRRGGLYGYIDTSGTISIAEKFDYAEQFRYGKARVYIHARPYYIDRKGNLLFEHQYKDIVDFGNHNYTVAVTASDKYCLIDAEGHMLTDTVFESMGEFSEGKVTAFLMPSYTGEQAPAQWDTTYCAMVIDSTGRWLIKPGQYTRIDPFSEGKAFAERLKKDSVGGFREEQAEFVEENGDVAFSVLNQPYTIPWGALFSDDRLVVHSWDSVKSDFIPGVIDDEGHLLFSGEHLLQITPYQNGMAFGRLADAWGWVLIDDKGEQVAPVIFEDVHLERYGNSSERAFHEDRALVKREKGWIFLNQDGKPMDSVSIPMHTVQAATKRTIVFYDDEYRIWLINEQRFLNNEFFQIAFSTLDDPLIRVQFAKEEESWGYINRYGEVMWRKEKTAAGASKPLNIDYLNESRFYAGTFNTEKEGGGWWVSRNYYRALDTLQHTHVSNTLHVYIDTAQVTEWAAGVSGYRVYIINDKSDTVFFSAQDSHLSAVLQAKDASGEWCDIEYNLQSWCGNSYHTVWLPPHYGWTASIPRYTGVSATRLRIKMSDISYTGTDHYHTEIYSNEINGSVNPSQFWRKRQYYSAGIMDPYAQ